MIQTPFLLRC